MFYIICWHWDVTFCWDLVNIIVDDDLAMKGARTSSAKVLTHFSHRSTRINMWCASIICKILLTHWGRVTHICINNLTTIGSGNGLSPGWRQTIIWTNTGIMLIGPLRINFSETVIEIHTFPFKRMHWKMLSMKWRPFCLGLNVLSHFE